MTLDASLYHYVGPGVRCQMVPGKFLKLGPQNDYVLRDRLELLTRAQGWRAGLPVTRPLGSLTMGWVLTSYG